MRIERADPEGGIVETGSMKRRYAVGVLIVVAVGIVLLRFATTPALGQGEQGIDLVSAVPSVPVHSPFSREDVAPAPRNADGHPDLNGMWDYAVSTPRRREPEFGEQLFLTPEEAAAYQQRLAVANDRDTRSDDIEYDAFTLGMNAAWFDFGAPLAQNRTSLIVDPPDGQIPALTAGAEEYRASLPPRDPMKRDHVTDRNLRERCLVIGNGPPFGPDAFNNDVHIFHRQDVVVIHTEMVHTARVIWLDGRAHHTQAVRQWAGDSRGRWAGDTLVIETTNFRPEASTWLGVANPEAFVLVERLTRIDAETVMYEYTMDDPETWTQPWTVQLPMKRLDGMMYEYACHEGNYGLKFQLSAARGVERQEAQAAHNPAK